MDLGEGSAILQRSEECAAGTRPGGTGEVSSGRISLWDPFRTADRAAYSDGCSVTVVFRDRFIRTGTGSQHNFPAAQKETILSESLSAAV